MFFFTRLGLGDIDHKNDDFRIVEVPHKMTFLINGKVSIKKCHKKYNLKGNVQVNA